MYVLLYGFFIVLFWTWGQFPSTSPQGRLFGEAIYRRVFIWGGGGLYLGGFIFRILRYMAVINLPRMLRLQCSIIVEDAYRMHAYIVHWLGPIKKMTYVLLRRKKYLQLCITMWQRKDNSPDPQLF